MGEGKVPKHQKRGRETHKRLQAGLQNTLAPRKKLYPTEQAGLQRWDDPAAMGASYLCVGRVPGPGEGRIQPGLTKRTVITTIPSGLRGLGGL